jgi:hypothetical protein
MPRPGAGPGAARLSCGHRLGPAGPALGARGRAGVVQSTCRQARCDPAGARCQLASAVRMLPPGVRGWQVKRGKDGEIFAGIPDRGATTRRAPWQITPGSSVIAALIGLLDALGGMSTLLSDVFFRSPAKLIAYGQAIVRAKTARGRAGQRPGRADDGPGWRGSVFRVWAVFCAGRRRRRWGARGEALEVGSGTPEVGTRDGWRGGGAEGRALPPGRR